MKQHSFLISIMLIFLLFSSLAFKCRDNNHKFGGSDLKGESSRQIRSIFSATAVDEPSEEVIEQLLTEKFTSNQYATRKETLEFESIDYHESNGGVYPVRVKCTRVIGDSDGTVKKFAMDGLFHFLKNREGEWTFNVQEWYRNEQI